MSKVDLILNASARRDTAPNRKSVRRSDAIVRQALLGLGMFLAGYTILSQPFVIGWINTLYAMIQSLLLNGFG